MSHKDLSYDEIKSLGADDFQKMFLQKRIERFGTDDLREVNKMSIPHIARTYERCADIFRKKRNYFLKMSLKTRSNTLRKQYQHMSSVYTDCLLVMAYQSAFAKEYFEWVLTQKS